MTKTNKGRVFITRWAVRGEDQGLVDFRAAPNSVVGVLAQMHYQEFLWIFGIPLSPEVIYELRVKGTTKPYVRKT